MAKSRKHLPYLYYETPDTVRILNSHRFGGAVVNSEVADWVSRVVAAGSGASSGTISAMDAFVTSAKANSYWSTVNRCNLFCGNDLTACLTPLMIGGGSTTETNIGSFASGDYTEATGLTGGGSKALNTGLSPLALGKNDHFFSMYSRADVTAVSRAFFGVGVNASDAWNAGASSTNNLFSRNGSSTVSNIVTVASHIGIIGMRRTSSTSYDFLENATISNQTATSSATASSLGIYIFARNDGSGLFWGGTSCGYFGGSYLDNTKYAAFRTDFEAFQDALGRGVL